MLSKGVSGRPNTLSVSSSHFNVLLVVMMVVVQISGLAQMWSRIPHTWLPGNIFPLEQFQSQGRPSLSLCSWFSRNLEDFITWADSSKIRKKVLKYNDKLDDYDLL